MPRPCKRRRICSLPDCERFGPADRPFRNCPQISMTLDEFEAIRLIDLEDMTQEQCAIQMEVARTTAQAIYNSARKKIAEGIVYGKELVIGGGDYVLCDGKQKESCCGRRCQRNHSQDSLSQNKNEQEDFNMKIAVTYENGQVFQHFGHTEYFKVYTVENGAILSSEVVSTNGSGHGALAGVLKELQVEVLVCGGIGGGAQAALAEAGIKLYGGVQGSADEAVEALLKGSLDFNPNVRCDHHDHEHHHEEGHSCGDHGCGSHSCH